ncbi:MAG: energy transducer TonB [Prevotellaceae bacterium]|jgi:TonB family protein|nr:energy transducer TonB [Prevotellaceae bacterium]
MDNINNNGRHVKSVITSIIVHAAILLLLIFLTIAANLKVDDTLPAPEKEFISVELTQPRRINVIGHDRVTPDKVTAKPVQQAPATVKISDKIREPKSNNKPDTRPVTAGNEGDVERYEPPQPKVNEKALFKSTADGTAEGDERNKIKDNSLYNGSGTNDEPTRKTNTQTGFTTSEQGVSFSLQGRSVSGGFPKPVYKLQKSGKVVVEIRVDQNGVVTYARATAKGSTLQDAAMWKAAEDAARLARFNVNKNAAISQMGTITYIFKLN